MSKLPKTLQSTRVLSGMDRAKIAETIQRALTAAGLNGSTGAVGHVNDTIRGALSSAGLVANEAEADESSGDTKQPGVQRSGQIRSQVTAHHANPAASASDPDNRFRGEFEPSQTVAPEQVGQFLSRTYSNAAGTRRYKLYIPSSYAGKPLPLIVMLHGCTQDPDDFAAGTRMNEWAEREGVLVIYPAQSANANGAKCWNWFHPAHQVPDRGEPSLIAGMTRDVASIYAVDAGRVFVAGLSAGAAMAVTLGAIYPELFAGVGAHSGLPYGAAYDLPSALAAMRGSDVPLDGGAPIDGGERSRSGAPTSRAVSTHAPPTIVFHSDGDATVNRANGSAIVSRAVTFASEIGIRLTKTVQERKSANGGQYTTTIYRDSTLRPHVEEWILHGSGHAWSGGSREGSYTDGSGPDASAEMLRFFLAQGPVHRF